MHLLRRSSCLLLLILSVCFSYVIATTFLWQINPYYFLIEPILLFGVPVLLISVYLFRYPTGLWLGKASAFFLYIGGLLIVGLILLTLSGGRATTEQAVWFWLVPVRSLKIATLLLGAPMWAVFIRALLKARQQTQLHRTL
jgi:hypothetical protein